jgi:hypothetical protein
MKPKQPPLTKFPCPTEKAPPQIIDIYYELTEKQKKWPVVPLSKLLPTDPVEIPHCVDIYPDPPLTEEQKKWPVIKALNSSVFDPKPVDPS